MPKTVPMEKSLTFSGWKLQGRRKVGGMDISIENKKGSTRSGKDKDGHKWSVKMQADYGYVRGTVGKDKDHLDCYVGPSPDSTRVFVIHQNDPTTGAYDEDKVMLGFTSHEEAKALYLKQYDRPGFFGSMEETDIETFKRKAMAKKNHGKKLVLKAMRMPNVNRARSEMGVLDGASAFARLEKSAGGWVPVVKHFDGDGNERETALPLVYGRESDALDAGEGAIAEKRLYAERALRKALSQAEDAPMEKARNDGHLVPRRVMVNRDGSTFHTTVWVNPETGVRQGALFDIEMKAPSLLDQAFARKESGTKAGSRSGRSKKENKEYLKRVRAIMATQGILVEDNTTRGRDLKRLPLYTMDRKAWAELSILDGKSAADLSDRGLLVRMYRMDADKKNHLNDSRATLLTDLSRMIEAKAAGKYEWADEHDHSVRLAIQRGLPVDPGVLEEYNRRAPREEWEYSVEDWQAIRDHGAPVSELSVEYMKRNWEKVAPKEEHVEMVPVLHAKTGEPMRSLATGEPAFTRRGTYTIPPIPESDEALREAFRAEGREIGEMYRASGGKTVAGTLVHYRRVRQALREGFNVPAHALAYYPDLRGETPGPGGGASPLDELAVGIKVEMEHTDDPQEAEKIARDHLAEKSDYYSRLVAAGLVDEPGAVAEAEERGLTKSKEWANHKYIKKVGNKYFYTEDEIRNFSLTRKADGFFYMDDVKITNDPEKARQFEEKVREHKSAHNEVKVGEKVRISENQRGSLGRGIVATVKEIGDDFARVMDEAGRMFRVPKMALAYARSMGDDETIFAKALSTRLVIPILAKARKSPKLVAVRRTITRDGATFTATYWVLPAEAKKLETKGAQDDLFDGPPPAAQLDLFDQAPAADPAARDKQVAEAIQAATPENRNRVQAVAMADEPSGGPVAEPVYEYTPGRKELGGSLPGLENAAGVDDYTEVIPKHIGLIPQGKALETERPTWIPPVSDKFFKDQGGRLPFAKLSENRYVVQTHGLNREDGAPYALVNLDVLVAMNDYYAKRQRARVKLEIEADIARAMEDAKKKVAEMTGQPENAYSRAGRLYYENVLAGKYKSRIKPFRVMGDNKMTYTQLGLIAVVTDSRDRRKQWDVFNEAMAEYKQKASDMAIQLEDNQSSYAKGQATSYGDVGTKDDLLAQYGVRVKRQNGDEITQDEIGDIRGALDAVFGCFGDRSSMARNYGLKISHSGSKLMHARRALGIYFPAYRAIGVTAQLGDKHMGFILSHEWAHFMDNYVGGKKYHYASDEPGSLANRIASTFRVSMLKTQKSDYQNRTCECFARAFEEYFSIKSGDAEILQEYRVGQGNYVDPEQFKKVVAPLIETFLVEKANMLKAMRVSLWSLE